MNNEKKIQQIQEINQKVLDYVQTLHDIVWEPQEGQSDHFDTLPKVEKVALIGIYNDVCHLNTSLNNYLHWFNK